MEVNVSDTKHNCLLHLNKYKQMNHKDNFLIQTTVSKT